MTYDVTCSSCNKIPTPNPTYFRSDVFSSLTRQILLRGRIVSLKLASHETGIVNSTASSCTSFLVSELGLTTVRDTLQDDRTYYSLCTPDFHIASHSTALRWLSTFASALASLYTQCHGPYRQPTCNLDIHTHSSLQQGCWYFYHSYMARGQSTQRRST